MAGRPVVIIGELYDPSLSIGGGPLPGGPPLGTWGGVAPPYPAHPIAPGGPPLGTWGGVAPPYPAHPIAPGGPSGPPPWGIQLPPLGTWGGVAPPYPAHPIAPGGPPPGTWGGGKVGQAPPLEVVWVVEGPQGQVGGQHHAR